MKKILPALLLLLFVFVISCKDKTIIENPPFSIASNQNIEIEKVELRDSVTILHFRAYSAMIRVEKSTHIVADGKKYAITGAEGIELEQWIDSKNHGGTIIDKLFFEPIPKATKTIDFYESGVTIWGIELKSNTVKNGLKLPAEYASVHKKYNDEKLENPVFKNGTAILSGQVLGFHPEFNVKITVYYDNIITGKQDDHSLEIDDTGFFKVEIPMVCRSQVLFRILLGNNTILNDDIVLTPDEESKVCINLQDYAKKVARLRKDKDETAPFLYFAGANASLNNQFYIHDITKLRKKYAYDRLYNYDTIAFMSTPAYKEYVYSNMNGALDEVSKFKTSNEIKRFFEGHVRYMFSSYLFNPSIEYAYQDVKKLSRGDEFGDDYIAPVIDSAYYSFMNDLPLKDPISLIYGQNYPINASSFVRYNSSGRDMTFTIHTRSLEKLLDNNLINAEDTAFVREIVLSDTKYISDEKFDSFKTVVRDFLNDLKKNPKVTPEAIKLIDKEFTKIDNYQKDDIINIVYVDIIYKITQHFDAGDKVQKFFDKINSLIENTDIDSEKVNDIVKKYENKKKLSDMISYKEVIDKQIGNTDGLLFDLIVSQRVGKKTTPFKDDTILYQLIKNEVIVNHLRDTDLKIIAKIEENKKKGLYNVHQVPVGSEDFFDKSIQSFAGKIVFVDFWATWCGPCLSTISSLEPKKEALMKKGVVFLYYTGETSPKATWDEAIPSITGEHFRVTDKQWNDLCKKYGIKGIPFYLIYNQEGELIHQGNAHEMELINKINSCLQ